MPENVVFGTGPLGLAVARCLGAAGKQVRIVNRSGKAPAAQGAQVVAADATDVLASRTVCEGAAVVYHCATGAYGRWAQFLPPLMNGIIEGASSANAKLVYGDNLYAYGLVDGPITEDLPYRPIGPNTRARADVANTLMRDHASARYEPRSDARRISTVRTHVNPQRATASSPDRWPAREPRCWVMWTCRIPTRSLTISHPAW